MKILALTGYDRSGKDTVAEFIETILYPQEVGIATFSYELKLYHMELLGIDDFELYNEYLHNNQSYNGIDLRDDIYALSNKLKEEDPMWIISRVDKRLASYQEQGYKYAIITDVRFKSEYEYIKSKNIKLVRIMRNSIPEEVKTKPWNISIKDFQPNYTIFNNRTLDDLYDETTLMLKTLNFI